MKGYSIIFFFGIFILIACESSKLTSLNGRWSRPVERGMFKSDTIRRTENFQYKVKSFSIWETDGLYLHVYKEDTLLKRYPDTLHYNFEFNLTSDTSGEMYNYFLKDSKELGTNEKLLFLNGSTQFIIDEKKRTIEYKGNLLEYRLAGEKLFLDGKEFNRVR